jgi:hypothetical protein
MDADTCLTALRATLRARAARSRKGDWQMPFWFFDFEEAARILARGGTAQEQEAQAIIY